LWFSTEAPRNIGLVISKQQCLPHKSTAIILSVLIRSYIIEAVHEESLHKPINEINPVMQLVVPAEACGSPKILTINDIISVMQLVLPTDACGRTKIITINYIIPVMQLVLPTDACGSPKIITINDNFRHAVSDK
jgi:hypothetical protein